MSCAFRPARQRDAKEKENARIIFLNFAKTFIDIAVNIRDRRPAKVALD